MKKPFVIGVTGEFGSGKSTVSRLLGRRGFRVLDADGIAHDLLKKNRACAREISEAFGPDVVRGGEIDRVLLAQRVFGSPRALRQLERILHPRIRVEVVKAIRKSGKGFVVIDAPLLIEAGWTDLVDHVIVVRANRSLQGKRLALRMGITRAEVNRRLRRQLPVREKCRFADKVIDNRGSLADLDRQVKEVLKDIKMSVRQVR
ncbi:MAG: dephospho-CoA kinase [Elusimicrobia bacterium]|nr:dephospho-CoA kinase [Elusimicrobiota bacterium]